MRLVLVVGDGRDHLSTLVRSLRQMLIGTKPNEDERKQWHTHVKMAIGSSSIAIHFH
jgi:hypothetical protein